ncbi:MAG: PfkB family carbohydrate kinase [Planctomycetota bacterium]|nr:PfkB family carbohydrate kinase [Planctomycetota bacterium]
MSLLVIGTLALDKVETPYAARDEALGGSATFFAYAAANFHQVGLVGVIGTDFPASEMARLEAAGVNTGGVESVEGKTFRWGGRYEADWNTRHTLFTDLGVFEHWDPKVPSGLADSRFVFLANAAPAVQAKALDQCTSPEFVMVDTMNLWIEIAKDDLLALLKRVDGIVLNDEEARMLTGENNLIRAAKKVLELGPKYVVLKKGEHGAFLVSEEVHFSLPAYPVENVVDPTGAGDSFAGGFMGYLASARNTDAATLKRAMLYGTVTASFCVEGFSVEELAARHRGQVEARFNELSMITTF